VTVSGPLGGVSVVVTRAKAQASVLAEKLEALGATVVGVPMIEIVAPTDGGEGLKNALFNAASYDQIVVTSPNGARRLVEAAADHGGSSFPPVACVGPSTAASLADSPFEVNLVPDRAVAEGLVDAMFGPTAGRTRLLLAQAEIARDILDKGLADKGWNVDRVAAYRTIDATVSHEDRARAGSGDVIVFTSSSTVERFVRLVGRDALPSIVASIGPITSATAADLSVAVNVEADPHTIDGLVDAVVSVCGAN